MKKEHNSNAITLIALIITIICKFITVNKLNLILIILFVILFHETITYLLLCLFQYRIFNNMTLIEGLYSSLIINVIYGYILYIIVEKINARNKRKRMLI